MPIITAATIRAGQAEYDAEAFPEGLREELVATSIRARGSRNVSSSKNMANCAPVDVGVEKEAVCRIALETLRNSAELGRGTASFRWEYSQGVPEHKVKVFLEDGGVNLMFGISERREMEEVWGIVRHLCKGAGLVVEDWFLGSGNQLPSFFVTWIPERLFDKLPADYESAAEAVEQGVDLADLFA